MKKNKQPGKPVNFFVILLAGVILVILFALVYRSGRIQEFIKRQQAVIQEIPISDSDEIEKMEEELETTEVGSPDSDLETLDADAATL